MSSPQAFAASSPFATSPSRNSLTRKKSRFTFKHLQLLSSYSTSTPLRCVALIDYDAFYAQCEQVRLKIADDRAVAVQQWGGLIAINYPARSYGLNRHVTVSEARSKCPDIVIQHVATWREGDDMWRYRDDSANKIHTDKVSLDPYRIESRKSLKVIKEWLPADKQRVEKASIDEVFLDLSVQIHALLLERYPELRNAPYDDPTEQLPIPPSTALDWGEVDGLVDLDEGESEMGDPDWDDVVMCIGSEIVRGLRKRIKEALGYTCSAGIARNKMMAKLGAGYKKPNQQTIVRNRAIGTFLSSFKFTKIRNLGGKLGEQIIETWNTEEVKELLKVPVEQFQTKLGDDTGKWLFGVIRGEDNSEVSSRTQIKSMLSAKSFRPSINSFEQATKWIKIFVADIYARLVEEGVTENKRRPKTMNLHHRQGGQMRSKQLAIPLAKKIDTDVLFDLAKNLLQQVIVDGRAWPCSNLSLSVGGFEDGISGNRGIGSFLVRGEEAKALEAPSRSNSATPIQEEDHPSKRRKIGETSAMDRFFTANSSDGAHEDEIEICGLDQEAETSVVPPTESSKSTSDQNTAMYVCPDCDKQIPEVERVEHADWHFARNLQAQDHAASSIAVPSNSRPPGLHVSKPKRGGPTKSRGRSGQPEKGQSRLAFGQ